jgi:predicted aspartyl protease
MLSARAWTCATLALALAGRVGVATAAQCTMASVAAWPVRLEHGHLLVDGTINARKIGAMLDTGGGTLILRPAAQRLGLVTREVRGRRAFGVGGETHVQSTRVDELTIGKMTRTNWRVMVAGENALGGAVDVILGEDFFDQLDVEFDLAHGVVRLFQTTGCEGRPLAYWATQGADEVDFVPYYDAEWRVIVRVSVNGRVLDAELDSGSNISVLDKPVAAQLGITPDSPGVSFAGRGGGLGGKPVDYWMAPLQSFTIGNETISDTAIRFADLWKDATYTPAASHVPRRIANTPALLLGADFLRAHRVLIAHSQRKLYFTYEGGPVFAPHVARQAVPDRTTDAGGAKAPAEADK